jgi:hypothetical protein
MYPVVFYVKNDESSLSRRQGRNASTVVGLNPSLDASSQPSGAALRKVEMNLVLQPPIHDGAESLRSLLREIGVSEEFELDSEYRKSGTHSTIHSFLSSSMHQAKGLATIHRYRIF